MQKNKTSISATIDFERHGAQSGFLRMPYSGDDSAWGAVMIPIAVIKNGNGPTAILTGGNHGDEYEGPIALFKLARTLRMEDVRGRIIIAPAMNYPAFCAARRTSPLDGGNLNRLFPGRCDGSATEKIADYFHRHLLPMADFVLDIHSGGKTLNFLPFAAYHRLPNAKQEAQCRAAAIAFGAPYTMTLAEIDNAGMYDTAAEEMGKIFVTTELGGGGSATAKSVAIAERGVRNFLKHADILPGKPESSDTIKLKMPDDAFVRSEHHGLAEFCFDLGARINKGDILIRIHNIHRIGESPIDYRSPGDGLFVARHFPGLTKPGDCLAVIAEIDSA